MTEKQKTRSPGYGFLSKRVTGLVSVKKVARLLFSSHAREWRLYLTPYCVCEYRTVLVSNFTKARICTNQRTYVTPSGVVSFFA